MNKYAGLGRLFLIALVGVVIGIAVTKLSGASLTVVVALVLGIGCFLYLRMRQGR